jgi:hypothetical protein
MPTEITLPTTVDNEHSAALAFANSQADRDALRPEDLTRVNLDVPSVVATVLGALPEVFALRIDIEKHLPTFDLKHVDQLHTYALALSHAFAQNKSATPNGDNLAELNVEGTVLRDNLLSDLTTLSRRGLVNPAAFKSCKGYVGYKNVATELQVLTGVARTNWSRIEGKCGISLDELDRGEKIATHMLRLVGLREQATEVTSAAADQRDRAFKLFIHSYDQVRRALQYLRWNEGDVEDIAPSLYAGRRRDGKEIKKEEPAPVVLAPDPVVPPVMPFTPAAPVPTGGPFVD